MKKILSVIMCVVLIMSACCLAAFAAKAENDSSLQNDNTAKILVCANKGDWQNAPENSVKAIKKCKCDYVSVDVKVTADGVPVLMEDETVDRTCVDENGNAVKGKVSELTYEEIKEFYLRNRNGGLHNEKTKEKVPSLAKVLNETFGQTLILDFALSDLDAVYNIIDTAGAYPQIIFRIDGKAKDVKAALSAMSIVPSFILKYDGNIIFSVNSTINAVKNSGLTMVQLGTKNQYGVIFYKNVENKMQSSMIKGVFSMTDGWNAKRDDNYIGWDDVISHGYSIIETNYPAQLNEYISQTEEARAALAELVAKCAEYDSKDYPQNIYESFKAAYNNALSLSGGNASKAQLTQAYTKLRGLCNELDVAQGTSISEAALKITPGRIIAAVLCLAAVVAAQVFFIKRKEK